METAAVETVRSYWDGLARAYRLLESPLRPVAEELQIMRAAVAAQHGSRGATSEPFRVLMLGMTPDVAMMDWPAGTELLAVDHSFAMVKAVWPGDGPGRRAICGNWLEMPLPDASCDVVIGDGSMNCVRYPEGFEGLAKVAARALRPGGVLVLRCYTQVEEREEVTRVLESVHTAENPSLNHFKFRLLMSMQENVVDGIAVADVYRTWAASGIDPETLARERGWDLDRILTLDLYEGSSTVHTFPTLAEYRAALQKYFVEQSCHFGSYFLADRCPILVLTAREGAGSRG